MFRLSSVTAFWLLSLASSQVVSANKLCFLLYQMSDNNLHDLIVSDAEELVGSELIKDPNVTSWIYSDGSPRGNEISGVLTPDGSAAPEDNGVRYINWDHTLQSLVLNFTAGELNSDYYENHQKFFTAAVSDCVAKGSEEYMLIFTSHGSGFSFGGDDDRGQERRRKLLTVNQDIVAAVSRSLEAVEGSPDKLDVLGFDACLQGSLESLKDYQSVTHYYMGSEALVPGTGYNYKVLTPHATALDLAKQMVDTFKSTPQGTFYGQDLHQSPKVLAIFDLNNIDQFYDAFGAMCTEMLTILDRHNDTKFYTVLSRSRNNAVSTQGYFDGPTSDPSPIFNTMDVGSFLHTFSTACSPRENSLEPLLADATTTYETMIVYFGVGPETKTNFTGLGAVWPTRKAVYLDPDFYKELWDPNHPYYSTEVPSYNDLLNKFAYYNESADVPGDGWPICGCPKIHPKDGLIMWDETVEETEDKEAIAIHAIVSDAVDSVLIEFGVDVTHLVFPTEDENATDSETRNRELLQQTVLDWKDRLRTFEPTFDMIAPERSLFHPSRKNAGHRRLQQNHRRALEGGISAGNTTEEYFLMFGGLLYPEFSCERFDTEWDKDFYMLTNASDGEPIDFLYVYRDGDTKNSIPVLYFPPTTDEAVLGGVLEGMNTMSLTIEDAEDMGGLWSYLQFDKSNLKKVNEDNSTLSLDALSLFTPSAGGAYHETPRSRGGYLVPILYVEAGVGNFTIDYILGGLLFSMFEWGDERESELGILATTAESTAFQLGVNSSVVDIVAYDFRAEGEEPVTQFNYFELKHNAEDGSIEEILAEGESAAAGVGFWVAGLAVLVVPAFFL